MSLSPFCYREKCRFQPQKKRPKHKRATFCMLQVDLCLYVVSEYSNKKKMTKTQEKAEHNDPPKQANRQAKLVWPDLAIAIQCTHLKTTS
jgi:hypothetical protein